MWDSRRYETGGRKKIIHSTDKRPHTDVFPRHLIGELQERFSQWEPRNTWPFMKASMALFCLKNRKCGGGGWGGGCLLSLFIKVSIVAKQNSELYILTSFTQGIKKPFFLKAFWNISQASCNFRGPLVSILKIKFSLYQCALAMKSFFVLMEIICFQFSDKLIELSSDSGGTSDFWSRFCLHAVSQTNTI